MKAIIPIVKGTRDFYPQDMALRHWLYQAIRKVSESFGYQEWDGPFLERIDLYAAKSGEELVKEQAFVFQDRGGDYVTLRPELTPTLARMIAQKQSELVFPLRWWSFGPFWRYERPQKGRSREFFQWNIDLIGVNTPEADAELIAICASFFKELGFSSNQVKIFINDRRLTNLILADLGVAEAVRPSVLHLIDRRDKMSPKDWEEHASKIGLSAIQFEGLKTNLVDPDLWKRSEWLQRLFRALDNLGVSEYVRYDAHVIRGLLYYTAVVFEAFDVEGGRAILGGGRYDNLVGDVGGDSLPAVGFAMGDVMLPTVLEKYNLLPSYGLMPDTILVTVFNEGLLPASLSISSDLRLAGIKTICYPEIAKLPKQLKFADRIGIHLVVIIGPDEDANNQVTIKNLFNRAQRTVSRSEASECIKEMLAQG